MNLTLPLQQFDIKNTFLHKNLEEEVWTDLPSDFSTNDIKGKVCRLKKSLYRLN